MSKPIEIVPPPVSEVWNAQKVVSLASEVPVQEEKSRRLPNKLLRKARFYFQTVGRLMPDRATERAYQLFTTPPRRAKHSVSDPILEAAVRTTILFNDQSIALYSWGNSDRIVLLAHGWESRGTALRMYVPWLVAKGYRVVAFDALAHGDSGGRHTNLALNAQTIAAVVTHFEAEGQIEAAICHSFGCSSITVALEKYRPDWAVRRLVFIAVPRPVRDIIDHYFNRLWLPNAVRRRFDAKIEALTNLKINDLDVVKSAEKVKVDRLLLVHDQQDLVTAPDAAERVLATWSNAQLLLTNGYGHFRIAKNKDVIKKIVDFIEN